ncbi:MAG: isoleucine--tRNA ligase [archaeon]
MDNMKNIEDEITQYWKKNNIPTRSLTINNGKERFYFLDGPPYATGSIHMGTAWNKILKDYYIRFFRMMGYDVWAQPGYDTHGLPIENKVEKKLNLKNKDEIEQLGIEKFNSECHNFATEHIETMNTQFRNIGVWMDWDNPYLTLHNSYIEGAWYTFKVGFEKGFLYKGTYPVHVCSHCATAVAYNEIEYEKAKDTSAYVKFPIKGKDNQYFVIWTTTPWTLPSNTGIMVHPSHEYAYVKTGKDTLIIAKERVLTVMKKARINPVDYTIKKTVKGKELENMRYDHPLKSILPIQKDIEGIVITSHQYVTLDDGTGLVHTAPGHGKEDFKVGEANNLKKICPVNLNGTFTSEVGKFSGLYVKDADKLILEELENIDALLAQEPITHDYPKCWRCKTPLLQMAVPQWFFKVTAIREKLLDENKKINWVPAWAKKRNKDWLESLSDWPISRQRYWGIPLPIWTCENEKCGNVKVIGSKDELNAEIKDLHRPYIDKITFTCEKCKKTMRRIPDVLDVWFDSGVASWASLNYPKEKALFEEMWPSKLNIEGPDQIRGWWNSEMITSVITFGRMPYETILMHGFVLDAKGIKMSKSLGNATGPEEVIEKYTRDILRYNLLSSAPENNFYFDWEKVKDTARFFNIYCNTYNFTKTYCTQKSGTPDQKLLTKEDKWIRSKANTLIKKCRDHNKKYHAYKSLNLIEEFILNDFSRWYIKLIRHRVSKNYTGPDQKEASGTVWYVMEIITKLLAPSIPYLSEKIYLDSFKKKESIHFEEFPKPDTSEIDKELEDDMETAKAITESINSARQAANVKLRWPIRSATIVADKATKESVERTASIIKEITNTKDLKFGDIALELKITPDFKKIGPAFGKDTNKVADLIRKENPDTLAASLKKGTATLGKYKITPDMVTISESIPENVAGEKFAGGAVYIDTTRDKELLEESAVRELTRKIQIARKEKNLEVTDVIDLYITGNNEFLNKWKKDIEKGTTSKLHIGDLKGKKALDFEFEDIKLNIAF